MKANRNLISSIVMLVLTSFLLITCIYAWYVSNAEAVVDGIRGMTAGNSYTFHLKYYDTSQSKWVAVSSFDGAVENMWPNDIVFFKVELDENSSLDEFNVSAKFDEVSSSVDEETVKLEKITEDETEKKYIYYNGIEAYEVINNNVMIEDKTLYNITEVDENKYVIKLGDFLLQNGILVDSKPIIKNDVPVNLNEDYDDFVNMDSYVFNDTKITKTQPLYFALYFADGFLKKLIQLKVLIVLQSIILILLKADIENVKI